METASLRMLSPNTNMLRTGSTFRALKMAMVATGSTAEISEPKAKLQEESESLAVKYSCAAICDAVLTCQSWSSYRWHQPGKKDTERTVSAAKEKSACGHIWLWAVRRWIDPHLSEEIDASSDYEGRDSCADHSEERNGANVLEEVSLNIQKHTHTQSAQVFRVGGLIFQVTLLHNMQLLKREAQCR